MKDDDYEVCYDFHHWLIDAKKEKTRNKSYKNFAIQVS
jgi:hypothetical protein